MLTMQLPPEITPSDILLRSIFHSAVQLSSSDARQSSNSTRRSSITSVFCLHAGPTVGDSNGSPRAPPKPDSIAPSTKPRLTAVDMGAVAKLDIWPGRGFDQPLTFQLNRQLSTQPHRTQTTLNYKDVYIVLSAFASSIQ